MELEVTFDLRDVTKKDVKDDLAVLVDGGEIAKLEDMLSKFAGKRVKVTFKELYEQQRLSKNKIKEINEKAGILRCAQCGGKSKSEIGPCPHCGYQGEF